MLGCTMNGVWGWMGPVGLIAMLGFWAVLIIGGVQVLRHFTGTSGPEQELARRFASGAITEDEYRDRLETLRVIRTRSHWGV